MKKVIEFKEIDVEAVHEMAQQPGFYHNERTGNVFVISKTKIIWYLEMNGQNNLPMEDYIETAELIATTEEVLESRVTESLLLSILDRTVHNPNK